MGSASLSASPPLDTFSFGGVNISTLNPASALDAFFELAERRVGGYIVSSCTHGVVESQHDKSLLQILNNAQMNLPDGMPTVWVGRMKGVPVSRVAAPDFIEMVMRDPRTKKLRHYFYGGSPKAMKGIVQRVSDVLGPDAIAGWYAPPFRKAGEIESDAVIADIATKRPHIIWVGLGLPKQEYWMSNHAAKLPESVMIGVGAAFDWFGGTQPRAPQVVQTLGLEWFFRLTHEPKRLWRRYSYVVPRALWIMLQEGRAVVGRRKGSRA
jgi:N-acetylglucosaminyldiphosphoundecaprenol N-acetyl-beta-D-mannosaminyltransferase